MPCCAEATNTVGRGWRICRSTLSAILPAEMARVFAVPREVIGEVLEGESVLLDTVTGRYFALNGSATRMWELLASGSDVAATLDQLEREFATDRAILARDLDAFIGVVVARGLLKEQPI